MPVEDFVQSPPGGVTSPGGRLVDLTAETTGSLPGGALPAHAAAHQNGGGDEISVAGLSGVLADPQTAAAHAGTHEVGGGDTPPSMPTVDQKAAMAGTSGAPSATNKYATNDDPRFEIIGDFRLRESDPGDDWAVAVAANGATDSNNGAPLDVFQFDDTIEEGVGYEAPLHVPLGVTKVTFHFVSRAETAPGAARTVGRKVYLKEYPDDGAVGAWSAGYQLADVDIPANENWQNDEDTVLLATLGITPGSLYRFEWTRVPPLAGVNLAGDWTVMDRTGISVRFS